MAPEVLQTSDEAVKIRYDASNYLLPSNHPFWHSLVVNCYHPSLRYDAPSDVYSFGILLWELAHRQTPFAGIDGLQVALVVAPSGERPLLQPPVGLEGLEPIIAACWHLDPDHRPTMLACMERLAALVSTAMNNHEQP